MHAQADTLHNASAVHMPTNASLALRDLTVHPPTEHPVPKGEQGVQLLGILHDGQAMRQAVEPCMRVVQECLMQPAELPGYMWLARLQQQQCSCSDNGQRQLS